MVRTEESSEMFKNIEIVRPVVRVRLQAGELIAVVGNGTTVALTNSTAINKVCSDGRYGN